MYFLLYALSRDYIHRTVHEYVKGHSSHIFPKIYSDLEMGQEMDRFSCVPDRHSFSS